MVPLILCSLIAILAWTFAAQRLVEWNVSGPVVMVCGGIIGGLAFGTDIATHLDTAEAERIVELILAVLLFADAIEVRGGFLAGERGTVARLLFLALPLSLIAASMLGGPLLPTSSWAVVLAIACVVMPIDFAPAADLLRDGRLPPRVRHVLAVESGYNDGVVSPIFAFALIMVGVSGRGEAPASALEHAVPAAFYAVLIGVGMGVITGFALRLSVTANWTNTPAVRVAMVLLPLITYLIAVSVGGNGFVAAFIAGIAYKLGWLGRPGIRAEVARAELAAVDSLSTITSMIMWFVFGAVSALVLETGLQWTWIAYGLLVLSLVRMISIYLSMISSSTSLRERTLLGLVGPRGTSSIVFGLLAFNAMHDNDASVVLYVMTVVVIGSFLLHGLAVLIGVRRLAVSSTH